MNRKGKTTSSLSLWHRGTCFLLLGSGLLRIFYCLPLTHRLEKKTDARRKAFIIDAGRHRRRRCRRPTTLGLHQLDLRLAFPSPRALPSHILSLDVKHAINSPSMKKQGRSNFGVKENKEVETPTSSSATHRPSSLLSSFSNTQASSARSRCRKRVREGNEHVLL